MIHRDHNKKPINVYMFFRDSALKVGCQFIGDSDSDAVRINNTAEPCCIYAKMFTFNIWPPMRNCVNSAQVLSCFRTPPSKATTQYSTKLCHMFGREHILKWSSKIWESCPSAKTRGPKTAYFLEVLRPYHDVNANIFK